MSREDAPTVNRAAVQLAVVGAIGILAALSTGLHTVPFFAAALSYAVLPVVLVVVSVPLALGNRRFRSVVGPSIVGRVLFILWAVSTALSQIALLGELSDDRSTSLQVETARQVLSLVAAASGIIAGVIILNSGPRSLARSSLIFGVVLFAVSESLLYAQTPVLDAWWGVPLALGWLLMGLSYLHSGLPDAAPVPEGPESLAE